ncbi:lipocalin-like domain-containing protein [Candidatus Paracaedibacter symbiosus]|uniref:lipocalin-like domain-containing protein n=1 Tax=Candidatus Paracaedibacter symbiosus TaxID=244582 RepID=UPI00050945FB|nr:lipocalin-like domain-containing protein [Candidatus Paracaedibacter symbiosus]
MDKASLVGTWKLLNFELRSNDGEAIYPFGKEPIGYIIYTLNDYMSVAIMSANRPEWSTNDFLGAPTDERLEIADNFIGYLGRYEIINDMINHYVEVSSFPNFIKVKQTRKYEHKDNQLILTSPPHHRDGKEMHYHVIWERA